MKRIANLICIQLAVIGFVVLVGLPSCKHESFIKTGEGPVTSPNPGLTTSLNGDTLYTNNCSGCHGPLATSAKLGATVAQIQSGISTVNNMKPFSVLTSAQIQAIANALATSTPPPPVTDGPTLYTDYCASCHGSLATSAKLNATVAQIQTGIGNVSQMSSLSSLSSIQIQAIANALVSTAPPSTDGTTLYANNCAGCHGPLATSAKLGATVARIQAGISTVSNMKSLSTLTSAQIQAIANVLASTPMPTDGPSLYAINCASCHGPLATSRVGRSSVSDIQQAIKQKNQMKYLSTLTTTQIQAIAGALANIKGGD